MNILLHFRVVYIVVHVLFACLHNHSVSLQLLGVICDC
jgi:hypothetical protein